MFKLKGSFLTLTALLCILAVLYATIPIANATAKITAPSLSAESAVLIDASSERIICQKNAHSPMAMASTTKIMTALVAAECYELDQEVSVSAEAVGVEGSSIYLFAGERMTMRDLISAMLLESANDAAAAIAIEVGGSIEDFCDMMNERAKKMGLTSTHFKNPHGLFDEEHYTTAYELAKIAAEALRNEEIKEIVSTKKITITPIEGNVRVLYNHNKMLSMYEGAIGVKTGFTKKSGRCLVSAAERDGLLLIAVTLNAPDDWNDHKKLLDTGFDSFLSLPLTKAGKVCHMLDVVGGDAYSLPLVYKDTLNVTLPKEESERLRCVIELYNRFEVAPIRAGKTVGRAAFYLGDELVASTELIVGSGANRVQNQNSFFDWLKNIFK